MPIVYDEKDKWRFLKALRYFNDETSREHTFRDIIALEKLAPLKPFEWPDSWPKQDPLVKILAFHLSENHYHLLIKEIKPDGTARFMQKLGTGFTGYINKKYTLVGRLFQGSYKAKVIDNPIISSI